VKIEKNVNKISVSLLYIVSFLIAQINDHPKITENYQKIDHHDIKDVTKIFVEYFPIDIFFYSSFL